MTDTSPASARRPDPPRPVRRAVIGSERAPDRRGEALHIFTTIFVRPALELREPIRRMVRDLSRDLGRERRRSAQPLPNPR